MATTKLLLEVVDKFNAFVSHFIRIGAEAFEELLRLGSLLAPGRFLGDAFETCADVLEMLQVSAHRREDVEHVGVLGLHVLRKIAVEVVDGILVPRTFSAEDVPVDPRNLVSERDDEPDRGFVSGFGLLELLVDAIAKNFVCGLPSHLSHEEFVQKLPLDALVSEIENEPDSGYVSGFGTFKLLFDLGTKMLVQWALDTEFEGLVQKLVHGALVCEREDEPGRGFVSEFGAVVLFFDEALKIFE